MGTYSGFWEKSIGKSKKLLMICILTTGVALSAHAQTYKYNKGDTVYNKHTKLTYVIDSVQVRKHNKQAFYYATDVFTKQQVQWLPENSLIKP
jgi:thermostable 8-oxoguanine DNA glycosylase